MEECKKDVESILNTAPDYIRKIRTDVDAGTTKPFKCAVLSCPNFYHEHYSTADEEPFKFHKFPLDPAIRDAWNRLCRLPETADAVMVCSEHFLPDDYERNREEEFRPLKPSAIPSLKLSGAPVHCIEVIGDRRVQLEELRRRVQLRKNSVRRLDGEIERLKSVGRARRGALGRVFSEAQIGVLRGRRKVVWSDDDLAMAFSLRHMSSRECYLYLKYSLNMPLPPLSCVQRWAGDCAVFGCGDGSPIGDSPLQFHAFPKDPEILQRWLTACVWKEEVAVETSCVCSLHFPPDAYTTPKLDNARVLQGNAVPSLKLIKSNEISGGSENNPAQANFLYIQPFEISSIKVEAVKDDNEESIEQLNEAIDRAQEEYRKLGEEYRRKRKVVRGLRGNKLTEGEETALLRKVFSESQIKILNGKKMIHWTNDDMVVGYTIRHMSSKRCYLYLSKNLNIPLPGLSSIKRWATIKK